MNTIRLNTIGILSGGGNAGGGGNSGEGGGDTPAPSRGAVNFRDYDGTILHSFTKDAFLALAEMPTLPTRQGLTCQGWNWSLDDAKAYVEQYGTIDIGATYITDDGKTRLYIKVEGERKEFPFKFSIDKANSLVIDWGDGVTESVSGSGDLNVSHIYDAVGDYVISLEVVEGAKLTFTGIVSHPYSVMLRKVELGEAVVIGSNAFSNYFSLSSVVIPSGVTSIGSNAFRNCYSLSSVVIPSGVTSIGDYAFNYCSPLSSVVIPSGVTSIGTYAFSNCYSLSSVVIPSGMTSIGTYAFYYCLSLSSVVIPSGVTSIGDYAFNNCYPLSSVVIPSGVTIGRRAFERCSSLSSVVILSGMTSIGSSAFNYCSNIAYYDFRQHTSVPTLSSADAFNGIASDCKIVVPDALYDSWISATNWSSYASYIIKASEFNG